MEMAAGALGAAASANLSIAVTGIAGPDGASPGKPVGMVCFGFSRQAGDGVVTRAATRLFEGDRRQVREAAVRFALQTAAELL
jgi:nicotinamide-nucleotide amidase